MADLGNGGPEPDRRALVIFYSIMLICDLIYCVCRPQCYCKNYFYADTMNTVHYTQISAMTFSDRQMIPYTERRALYWYSPFQTGKRHSANAARFVQTINPHPMPTADTMSKYQSLWKSEPNRLSANLLKGFYIAVWKAYTYRIVILSLDRNHFLVSTLNYVYWTEEVNLSYDGMAHQVTNDSLSELEQKIDTFFKSG